MAQQYQHIDLTTLQEVERLLTSTDFEDHGSRSQHLSNAAASGRAPDSSASSDAPAPLPKRA